MYYLYARESYAKGLPYYFKLWTHSFSSFEEAIQQCEFSNRNWSELSLTRELRYHIEYEPDPQDFSAHDIVILSVALDHARETLAVINSLPPQVQRSYELQAQATALVSALDAEQTRLFGLTN